MNNRKSVKRVRLRHLTLIGFSLFIFIALITVLLLEYIDFRQGKDSLVFSRIIRLQEKTDAQVSFHEDLAEYLKKNRLAGDFLQDGSGISHLKLTLVMDQFQGIISELRKLAKSNGGKLELADRSSRDQTSLYLYQVVFHNKITHVLLVSISPASKSNKEETKKPESPGEIKKRKLPAVPRIALIIDDVGYIPSLAAQLKELNIPLTGAVIPGAPYAPDQAIRLISYGMQVLIHLPMESKNNHMASDGELITSRSTPADIRRILLDARRIIPQAIGVNNHMGSLITSRKELIQPVLEAVGKEGLFFIDSRTTEDTEAFTVARELGIPTISRDVFLDSVQTEEFAQKQLIQLARMAKKNGKAVAIGHPFETTLRALKITIPWLKEQGLEWVFVSTLVE